ncbi:MAG: hypothetical protein AAGE80_05510 [Pseudomonadota bacterium]
MTPDQFSALKRSEIHKLAKEGKLIDTAFQVFADACFANPTPDQRETLRIAFFMGARELFSLLMDGCDEVEPMEDDLRLCARIEQELETFSNRTAMMAQASGRAN